MEVDKNDKNQNIFNSENNLNNNNNENMGMNIEDEVKINNLQKKFTKFLNEHTIYEAIPEDMKILVFNDELLIKDSIEAMIKEDIYCGLLYNGKQNKHSGVFTIRDVLGLLLIGYKNLVSFLNNNKNINSYEALKTNLLDFFVQFDGQIKNENIEQNFLKQNENKMDIEGEEEENSINNRFEFNNNENDTVLYNNIIKDFSQFISLFVNIFNLLDILSIKTILLSYGTTSFNISI